MRSLDVNLASQPFRNNTLLWVGYGLGFTILLAFLAWNTQTWLKHRGFREEAKLRLEDMDSRLAELDRRENVARREQSRAELDLTALNVQAVAANEVIERKAFSWTRLFNRVEQTIPWNVHLTSVRPLFRAKQDRRVKTDDDERESIIVSVEGYSKDLSAFLDFESALIADPSFDFPEPRRHQRNERNEILFELDFTYYPEDEPSEGDAVEAEDDTEAVAEAPAGADAEILAGGPVGGDGPAEAEAPGDEAPVDGVAEGVADPRDDVAEKVADAAAEAAEEPLTAAPGAGVAPDPAEGVQRIPPRPYADEPAKDAEAKPKTNRRPPRRRPKDDKKDDGGAP